MLALPNVGAPAAWQRAAVRCAIALFALAFVAPFVVGVHRYPIASFESEWIAAVVLGAALLCAALAGDRKLQVNWPLPAIAGLLLAVAGAQTLLGMLSYTYALAALFIFLCAWFAAYLGGRWLVAIDGRDTALRALSVALIAGGVFSFAVQTAQALDIETLPDWLVFPMAETLSRRRPYGNLAQPNHLATYLALGSVAALYLLRQGLARPALLVALALLQAGLALTGSRMGSLFVLGLLALILTPNALTAATRGDRLRLAFVLALGYAAGLVMARVLLVDAEGATETALQRYAGTFGQRLSMWGDALRVAALHPLLGVGAGEYGAAQYLYARPSPVLEPTSNPHNLVLHLAAEFGWPVAAGVVAIVVLWFRRRAVQWSTDAGTVAALAMIGLVLLHAQLEYPLSHLHFLVLIGVLAGLAEPAEPDAPARAATFGARFVFVPIGCAILATATMMRIDYEGIVPLWTRYLEDIRTAQPHHADTVAGITSTMGATFFKPQMERLYVELVPLEAQKDPEDLALVGRVLTRLGDVRVIVRYIELLVQAGRVDQAYLHVGRLKILAGSNYPYLRDELLAAFADGGPQLDTLRMRLRAP